ncbi:hypothetical protein KC960_04365 [Candidatus Saccharibacteria bacterium]|nr:hypothetical protein [Candidatus Saccharibacteria bacterium]
MNGLFQTAKAAENGVAVPETYGLTTDSKGRIIGNPADIFEFTWVNAGLAKLTFKTKPGISYDVVPKDGHGDAKGVIAQRTSLTDGNHRQSTDYEIQGWPSSCYNKITFIADSITNQDNFLDNTPLTKVKTDIDFYNSDGTECKDSGDLNTHIDSDGNKVDNTGSISVKNTQFSTAYFRWVDSAKIEPAVDLTIRIVESDHATSIKNIPTPFVQDSSEPNVFRADEVGPCDDVIIVDKSTNPATMKYYILVANGSLSDGDAYGSQKPASEWGISAINISDCQVVDVREDVDKAGTFQSHDYYRVPPITGVSYPLLDNENANKEAGTGEEQAGSFNLETGEDTPTCESSGFSLAFLFCPIVNGALDGIDWMFHSIIEPFLVTSPLTTESNDTAYQVWRGFRTLGNIILVIALLVIVFGQAIGGGLVDAYTAKKAMPRILIAAILINISYFIVALSVDVFNVLGRGIGQLITAPLGGAGSFSFKPNQLLSLGGLFATYLGGKFLLGFFTTGGFFTLLLYSFLIPMLLTTIAIFGTIVIRRGLVILLAVISPIALALYAIPGTEKYAKKWFDLFIKTLMVYPIIMAIFAIADLLSMMMFSAAGDGGSYTINQFVALVVLFIPFFLIPFAFKLAGGAISSISGAITGFNKKRYEKFMGSEYDQSSRRHQVNHTRASMRDARLESHSNRALHWADFRVGRGGLTLLKQGMPKKPEAPTPPRDDAGAAEKEEYTRQQEAYVRDLKTYNAAVQVARGWHPTVRGAREKARKYRQDRRARRADRAVTEEENSGAFNPDSPLESPPTPVAPSPIPSDPTTSQATLAGQNTNFADPAQAAAGDATPDDEDDGGGTATPWNPS